MGGVSENLHTNDPSFKHFCAGSNNNRTSCMQRCMPREIMCGKAAGEQVDRLGWKQSALKQLQLDWKKTESSVLFFVFFFFAQRRWSVISSSNPAGDPTSWLWCVCAHHISIAACTICFHFFETVCLNLDWVNALQWLSFFNKSRFYHCRGETCKITSSVSQDKLPKPLHSKWKYCNERETCQLFFCLIPNGLQQKHKIKQLLNHPRTTLCCRLIS